MTETIQAPGAKAYQAGTHRCRAPEETLADFGRHSERAGITRLANITGLDWVGIPVYTAIRPNSRSLSVSQGKGATHAAAQVSALMESLEYWHAEHLTVPLRHESHRYLAGEGPVIDVDRLPLRAGLDGLDADSPTTPALATFVPDEPTLWTTGRELGSGRDLWLPFDTVRLNKVGLDYAATTFRVSSNGLASGNTFDEAVLHGVCELVERDALTLWWQGVRTRADVRATKIALDSVTDPVCRGLLDRLAEARIDVAVWDATSDVGVPTYQCCLIEQADRALWRPFGACWGYGTHPSPAVALSRALTEAAQTRVTVIAASRDENFRSKYSVHHDAAKDAKVRAVFFADPGEVDFASRPGFSNTTVDADLADVVRRLRGCGLDQVVVVDLTKLDLGVPVVKVVVPGLEFYALFVGYSAGPRARAAAARREARA